MRRIIIVLIAIVIVAGGTSGVYEWQIKNTNNLRKQQTALKQKVSSLQSQYAAAKAVANISTSGWKQFCDQFAPLCFSYPSQWVVTDSSLKLPGDNREFASVTNPNKTIQINYDNPLFKDGGSLSVRIIKVSHTTVNGTKLAVLGIIPVSSGVYSPSYIVLDSNQALSVTPSDSTLLLNGSINPRFTVGQYHSILFTGSPTRKITSYAQAQAWFDSIDGNTTLKILESLTSQ
jgi:hypothetical protein